MFGLDDPSLADGGAGDTKVLDAGLCWSVPEVAIAFCLAEPLTGSKTIQLSTMFDTDASDNGLLSCADTNSPALCVIAADTITIGASGTLAATGSRPLVMVAHTIVVDGTIDVASHAGDGGRPAATGPGADATDCIAGETAIQSGGGHGGSFGTMGGNGGDQQGEVESGAKASPAQLVVSFRGGCPGGGGGGSGAILPGGTLLRGSGGGAIALLASTMIHLGSASVINASGAAAGATDVGSGGSGAGSGGMIVFQTSSIAAQGSRIFANGGGGAGGGSETQAGQAGSESMIASEGGQGGQGAIGAGRGGVGYPGLVTEGSPGTSNMGGGGGGGGGAGVIRVYGGATLAGAIVSPSPN
ncbi:MAG TPA: hypothetical protein VIV11_02840 [Kofleriaceae bacterium]